MPRAAQIFIWVCTFWLLQLRLWQVQNFFPGEEKVPFVACMFVFPWISIFSLLRRPLINDKAPGPAALGFGMFGFLYVLPTNLPKPPLSLFTFIFPGKTSGATAGTQAGRVPASFQVCQMPQEEMTVCAHAGAHTSIWGSEPTRCPPGVCFHCSVASPVLCEKSCFKALAWGFYVDADLVLRVDTAHLIPNKPVNPAH